MSGNNAKKTAPVELTLASKLPHAEKMKIFETRKTIFLDFIVTEQFVNLKNIAKKLDVHEQTIIRIAENLLNDSLISKFRGNHTNSIVLYCAELPAYLLSNVSLEEMVPIDLASLSEDELMNRLRLQDIRIDLENIGYSEFIAKRNYTTRFAFSEREISFAPDYLARNNSGQKVGVKLGTKILSSVEEYRQYLFWQSENMTQLDISQIIFYVEMKFVNAITRLFNSLNKYPIKLEVVGVEAAKKYNLSDGMGNIGSYTRSKRSSVNKPSQQLAPVLPEDAYSVNQFAKLVNKTPQSIRTRIYNKTLVPHYTEAGKAYFTEESVAKIKNRTLNRSANKTPEGTYSHSEFAKLIGRSKQTIITWEHQNKLLPNTSPSGGKYYTDEHIEFVKNYSLQNRLIILCPVTAQQHQPKYSQVELAKQFNITGPTMSYWIKKYNIKPAIIYRKRQYYSQEQFELLQKLRTEKANEATGTKRAYKFRDNDIPDGGYTMVKFSRVFNKLPQTVRYWLNKYNIQPLTTELGRKYYTDEHIATIKNKMTNKEKIVSEITSKILDSFKDHPIVLLLGDSGGGKTYTTFKMIEHDIANDNFWILITHDAINVGSYLPDHELLTIELSVLENLETPTPQVVLTESLKVPLLPYIVVSELAKIIVRKAQTMETGKFTLYIDDAPNEVTIELLNILRDYGTLKELNIKLVITDYGDLLKYLMESKQSQTTILLGSN